MIDDEPCFDCEGTGRVFDYDSNFEVICERCNGMGWVSHEEIGIGWVSHEENERKTEQ